MQEVLLKHWNFRIRLIFFYKFQSRFRTLKAMVAITSAAKHTLVLNQDMSRVACSAHTKASGDHRASTRCVSRILACALRRDTMAAAAAAAAAVALYVSPLFCTPWTGGANGERLAFLPVGRFLCLPLFLSLFAFFFLSLSHPLPRSVFLSKDSGHYLGENFLFSPATAQRNSIVRVDC